MNLTFDRRYDKWEYHRKCRERCEACMYDAPYGESCCKHHCGESPWCAGCTAKCRVTKKLCERSE